MERKYKQDNKRQKKKIMLNQCLYVLGQRSNGKLSLHHWPS